jgi:Acetoacetate decarboxylase (ADC)
MPLPPRQDRLAGRHALVDDIPFTLPVNSLDSPALMAAFTVDADAAQALLPGNELHMVRLPNNRGLLVVTVIDYRTTDIGPYVEYSIALGVTHGEASRPLLTTLLFSKRSGVGQYVWDLPVSSKISVKGGRGIWGMPKHQANLDFRVDKHTMSSQYDLDGELCMRITVNRNRLKVPLKHFGAANYCAFRGMLMKSSIYFSDKAEVAVGPLAHAQLLLGPHKRMDPLRTLDINDSPLFTATLPHSAGVLDDHYEGWFLTSPQAPDAEDPPEGLEQVYGLPNDESWLEPPSAAGR